MKFEIIGYREYTGYDKVYFSVEADSAEEALMLVKDEPSEFVEDYKALDIGNSEFVDFEDWEVL